MRLFFGNTFGTSKFKKSKPPLPFLPPLLAASFHWSPRAYLLGGVCHLILLSLNTPTSSLAWVPIVYSWHQWDLDFCGPAPTSKPQPSYHFGEPWEPTGTGNPRPSTSHYLVYYYSRDWLGLVFENLCLAGVSQGWWLGRVPVTPGIYQCWAGIRSRFTTDPVLSWFSAKELAGHNLGCYLG